MHSESGVGGDWAGVSLGCDLELAYARKRLAIYKSSCYYHIGKINKSLFLNLPGLGLGSSTG